MTLFAGNANVSAGESKASFRVVKAPGRFPIRGVMALGAVGSELTAMFILVTRNARPGKTKEGLVEILNLDGRAFTGADSLRRMTTLARGRGVFSLKHVASLGMIEPVGGGVPSHHGEVQPVVFRMAGYARLIPFMGIHDHGMQAASLLQANRDLLVTVDAAKVGRPSRDGVALGAAGWTIQVGMKSRERTGRELRMSLNWHE